jgi:hypothetical protein
LGAVGLALKCFAALQGLHAEGWNWLHVLVLMKMKHSPLQELMTPHFERLQWVAVALPVPN